MSGLVRLNTGDSKNTSIVTENVTSQTQTYATSSNNGWQTVHAGANSTLSASSTGDCGNSGTGSFSTSRGCRYYVENRTRTDTKHRIKHELPLMIQIRYCDLVPVKLQTHQMHQTIYIHLHLTLQAL